MEVNPLHFVLGYLTEYELGGTWPGRHTNVPIKIPHLRGGTERIRRHFGRNPFAWHQAQRLEGVAFSTDEDGVWPINYFRCERRYGSPGDDIFPPFTSLSTANDAVYSEAFKNRLLCYHRVANVSEAKETFRALRPLIRYATELTCDWYDPPNGNITVAAANPTILGSHGIPLEGIEQLNGEERFVFPNSWGWYWGDDGRGSIAMEHFDRFMVEAWDPFHLGGLVPFKSKRGLICLEWMWSVNEFVGIHVREIVNAANGEYVAWAFCRRRGEFLDVEEFFVWPTERRKGYGRELARMVRKLSMAMGVPIRLLVSYADTEEKNRSNLEAAARLFGVHLAESGVRWVHQFGTSQAVQLPTIRGRPARPKNALELVRPSDEQPSTTPVDEIVFFGTNRLVDPEDPSRGFGGERDTELHLGRMTKRIPITPQFGSFGRMRTKVCNLITRNNPSLLESALFQNEAEFGLHLKDVCCDVDKAPHNLLYVHGYRSTFQGSIEQAARFGAELKIPGKTFCYSWPSRGRFLSYFADETAVDANVKYLREYISIVLRQTGDEPLSIIAHSMGNRVVVRCLEAMAQNDSPLLKNRISQLILAAPDVDSEVFSQASEHFLSVPKRTTLYVSRGDIPLFLSALMHRFGRVGLAPSVTTRPNMDTVLVHGFSMLNAGHRYYAEADSVAEDMFLLIQYGAEPRRRRKLVATRTKAGEIYWKLRYKK